MHSDERKRTREKKAKKMNWGFGTANAKRMRSQKIKSKCICIYKIIQGTHSLFMCAKAQKNDKISPPNGNIYKTTYRNGWVYKKFLLILLLLSLSVSLCLCLSLSLHSHSLCSSTKTLIALSSIFRHIECERSDKNTRNKKLKHGTHLNKNNNKTLIRSICRKKRNRKKHVKIMASSKWTFALGSSLFLSNVLNANTTIEC